MKRVCVLSPAKINLTLAVTGRRVDGYHGIETVMQSISLYDTVTAEKTEEAGISLTLPGSPVAADATNTAYRAAAAFFAHVGITPAVRLTVEKRIPVQAGLGGGSADAAGVLLALNSLFSTRLSLATLCQIGATVGADVPFCVQRGTAFADGIGTTLHPLPQVPACTVLLLKPPVGISTAEAYRWIDEADTLPPVDNAGMQNAIRTGDYRAVVARCANDFDAAVHCPEVNDARQKLLRGGADCAVMSGSGSAVFGLFAEEDTARRCAAALAGEPFQSFICHPCD